MVEWRLLSRSVDEARAATLESGRRIEQDKQLRQTPRANRQSSTRVEGMHCSPQRYLWARSARPRRQLASSPRRGIAPRSRRKVRLPRGLPETVRSERCRGAAPDQPAPSWHVFFACHNHRPCSARTLAFFDVLSRRYHFQEPLFTGQQGRGVFATVEVRLQAVPACNSPFGVFERQRAYVKPAIDAVEATHTMLDLVGFLGLHRSPPDGDNLG